MAIVWNAENAAHLLNRAGFGGSPKDIDKAVKRGFEKTLAKLSKPIKKTPKQVPKVVKGLEDVQTWWVSRMVKTKTPLAEKMTLFWHNHFATAISKVNKVSRMHVHVSTLQKFALANFKEMVLAVARDPAMIIWLDNKNNEVGSPNENFARELMELFTTGILDKNGVENYTEQDVVEVARAFTGWHIKDDEFFFKENKHDFGTKTVKGITGNFDGTDVIDILVNDDATARRIPMKIFSYLAYPIDLTDPLCDQFEAVYVQNNGEILPIVEAILRHDAFYSDEAKNGRIKAPAEFLVSSLARLKAKFKKGTKKSYPSQVGDRLQDLGQSLYDPPTVFGWDEGLPWVSSTGMLARASVGDWISEQRDKKDEIRFKPQPLLGKKKTWKTMDAAAVVETLTAAMGLTKLTTPTRAALEAYVAADDDGLPQPVVVDNDFIDKKVRGLIALILASPDYQMA